MISARLILLGGFYKDTTFPGFPPIGMELNAIFFGTTDIKTVRIVRLKYNLDYANFMHTVDGIPNTPPLLVYVEEVD
jgi:hypothetical protein